MGVFSDGEKLKAFERMFQSLFFGLYELKIEKLAGVVGFIEQTWGPSREVHRDYSSLGEEYREIAGWKAKEGDVEAFLRQFYIENNMSCHI